MASLLRKYGDRITVSDAYDSPPQFLGESVRQERAQEESCQSMASAEISSRNTFQPAPPFVLAIRLRGRSIDANLPEIVDNGARNATGAQTGQQPQPAPQVSGPIITEKMDMPAVRTKNGKKPTSRPGSLITSVPAELPPPTGATVGWYPASQAEVERRRANALLAVLFGWLSAN